MLKNKKILLMEKLGITTTKDEAIYNNITWESADFIKEEKPSNTINKRHDDYYGIKKMIYEVSQKRTRSYVRDIDNIDPQTNPSESSLAEIMEEFHRTVENDEGIEVLRRAPMDNTISKSEFNELYIKENNIPFKKEDQENVDNFTGMISYIKKDNMNMLIKFEEYYKAYDFLDGEKYFAKNVNINVTSDKSEMILYSKYIKEDELGYSEDFMEVKEK